MNKKRSFLQSLNDAVEGFVFAIKSERNMRIHFMGAIFVMMMAIWLGLSRIEWIILCGTVTLVLVAEMINTAIEYTVDLIKGSSYDTLAKTIKHISAGTVLVSALNALIIGFFIFSRHLERPIPLLFSRMRYTDWYLTFVSLLLVVFLVIAGKAFWKHGTPLRGGAISGHSAVAFSMWTIVLFCYPDNFVIVITLLLALLVAQSRLRAKIHSLWEVAMGALVGTLVTALFFQVFR